jgi:hypothetical protein
VSPHYFAYSRGLPDAALRVVGLENAGVKLNLSSIPRNDIRGQTRRPRVDSESTG